MAMEQREVRGDDDINNEMHRPRRPSGEHAIDGRSRQPLGKGTISGEKAARGEEFGVRLSVHTPRRLSGTD